MTPEHKAGFDWGKKFSDLVRTHRLTKRSGLTAAIQKYTGLDEGTSRKLCSRVTASDKNMVAFCEAKRLLTLEELKTVVNAKDMPSQVRKITW